MNEKVRNILVLALFAVISFAMLPQASLAQSPTAKRVTLSYDKVPVSKVFGEIRRQTGLNYIMKSGAGAESDVSVNANEASVQSVVSDICRQIGCTYEISGGYITITPRAQASAAANGGRTLHGTVVNAEGEPLIGVTVVPDNSVKNAVVTDVNGHFAIPARNVKFPCRLSVKYVGFDEQTVNVAEGRLNLGQITMKESAYSLNDVVVIGYGEQSRKLLTGSVSEVKGDVVTKATQDSPILALQGHASGVYIEQASGMPGGGSSTILIRGAKSLMQGTKPLYIIDGVPFNSNNDNPVGYTATGALGLPDALGFLNPDDIESIDVLKDADATAIYGTRGSNGVILITTKKGQSGKVKVNVSYAGTAQWIGKRLDFADTKTYLDIRRKAFEADKSRGLLADEDYTAENFPDLLLWDRNKNYDWQDILLGNTAWGNDIKASVSGGNRNTSFFVSGGYYDTGTPTVGDDKYKRWNLRSNIAYHTDDNRFNLEAGLALSQITQDADAAGSGFEYLNAAPNTPPYNDDGCVYWIPNNREYKAPLALLNYKGHNKATSVTANVNASYRIWDNLVAKVTFGYEHSSSDQQNLYNSDFYNPYQPDSYNEGRYRTESTQSLNVEPQLTYSHDLFGGTATVLVGGTYQSNEEKLLVIDGTNYPGDMFLADANSAASISYHHNPTYQSKMASFFSRLSYNYANRYLLNAVYRRDGSSKFGSDHRWGDFWSVGGGWIFSNEKFMKENFRWLSYGKLRLSYGKTGSTSGISDYQYMSMYKTSAYTYEGKVGIKPDNLENANLHWESTKKFDVGLSLGFFDDRLLLEGSYYNERSNNLLTNLTLPYQTGFSSITSNQPAEIENSGFEVEFNTVNISNKDWKWTTNLNFTFPKNKLLRYPGLESSAYSNTYEIGKSINIFRGYRYTGVDPETGVPTVEDVDGDGKITSANDYQTLGSVDASFYGGLSNTVKFKNFTLCVNFYFRRCKYKPGYYYSFFYPIGTQYNITKDMAENYWTTPGQTAKYPGLTTLLSSGDIGRVYSQYLGYSDFAYSSGSYLRLKNVRLAFDLPRSWLKPAGISALQVYAQGNNLFTITSYDSYDPEAGYGAVPVANSFSFGVNITF